jgi:outer membrane murein-binding lipoprotein Lpp
MPRSPDPKNPMRYMTRLDTNEQLAMSQEQMARTQQVMAGCQGGGAAQTADASARAQELAAMHDQRRAQRNAPPADAGAANSAAQAWLDAHPFTPRKYAAGSATQADYLEKSGTLACFNRTKGFRAKELADKLSTKRNSIAAEQRQQLEGWITAWRAAEQAGSDEPTPPAGSDAQGYLRLLSNSDQQEVNMATSIVHNKVRDECNGMDHMELNRQ